MTSVLENPRVKVLLQMFKFVAAGMPAFLIAFVLNYVFVDHFHWEKKFSYAIVLTIQVVINFFMCIKYVFEHNKKKNVFLQFSLFMILILGMRNLDYRLYGIIIEKLHWHYLFAQLGNVFVFFPIKYFMAKKVLE